MCARLSSVSYKRREKMIAYSVARRFFIFPLSACLVGIFQQMISRTEKRKSSTTYILHILASMLCKSLVCVCVSIVFLLQKKKENDRVFCSSTIFYFFPLSALGMHQCQLTGYKLRVLAVKPMDSCSMKNNYHSMLDPVGLGTPS